jgi:hypothetical protein
MRYVARSLRNVCGMETVAIKAYRVLTPSFCKILCICTFTVPPDKFSSEAIALFERPRAASRAISCSRVVKLEHCSAFFIMTLPHCP